MSRTKSAPAVRGVWDDRGVADPRYRVWRVDGQNEAHPPDLAECDNCGAVRPPGPKPWETWKRSPETVRAELPMLITNRIRGFCSQHALGSSTASFIQECIDTGAETNGPWVRKSGEYGGSCLFGSSFEATEVVAFINWARSMTSHGDDWDAAAQIISTLIEDAKHQEARAESLWHVLAGRNDAVERAMRERDDARASLNLAVTCAVDAALVEIRRQGGPEYLLKEARSEGIMAARVYGYSR